MLKAGLTGNIGSGKSAVASIFSSLGIPVFHADEESKKFLGTPEVIDEIARSLGKDIIVNGLIDKRKLASLVFGDRQSLNHLNGIMHPLVLKEFNKWISSESLAPYVIMEAAILFESGYNKEFDRIIHVSCPEERAIARVIARDGTSREHVLARMQYQIKDDDKARMSDFVIINDGTHLVISQVMAIHKSLLEIGA